MCPYSCPCLKPNLKRSVCLPWKFTQLNEAAFPPAWKSLHTCMPSWAWSFARLSLVLSPCLWNRERAGLILLLLCHSGIAGFTFSGKAEVGSYTGRLLPQIFQHIHTKSLVWTTSILCSSCQSTSWNPGNTSSRLAGHLSSPPVTWPGVQLYSCSWSRDCSLNKVYAGMEFLEKYCSSKTDEVPSRGHLGRLFGWPDWSTIFPPMCREGDVSSHCTPPPSSTF